MSEPVPVSPAAQAEPPELWWSPTCGLFGYVDGMGTGDSIGPLHARADDAVRLVPAPGPDVRLHTAIADEAVNAYEAAQGGDDPTTVLRRVIGNLERLAGAPALLDRIYGPDESGAAGVRTDGETSQ